MKLAARFTVAAITFGLGFGIDTLVSRHPRSVPQTSTAIQISRPLPVEVSGPNATAVYNIDSLSGEDFLEYNYRELAQLAISGSAKQKEWLRKYLKTCDKSGEKQSLQEALKGARP